MSVFALHKIIKKENPSSNSKLLILTSIYFLSSVLSQFKKQFNVDICIEHKAVNIK